MPLGGWKYVHKNLSNLIKMCDYYFSYFLIWDVFVDDVLLSVQNM